MLNYQDLSELPPEIRELNGLEVDDAPQKDPTRVQAGTKAKARGKLYEREFDDMADRYASEGLAVSIPQYPEFVEQGRLNIKGRQRVYGYWKAHGEGDRLIYIPDCGMAAIEIKSVTAAGHITLTKGLHQFDTLKDRSAFGMLAGYILRWEWNEMVDWRLYLIDDLEMVDGGIKFYRSTGLEIPLEYPQQIPDWLPVLKRVMRCLDDDETL